MESNATPSMPSPQAGSLTPGLEGAPRSVSHQDRMKSVISSPAAVPAAGKEGSPSKL